ncbi:MAG: acyltransferase [Bacteroidota bacterium]|nr:acyltransferase [Bacteroidota bacterium]
MEEVFCHNTAIIDEGAKIGKGSKVWHFSHIMQGAEIGENCNIGQNVFIAQGVKIGSGVKVQNNVSLYTGVICQEDVFLGPSCVFTNVVNPRSFIERKNKYKPTLVKKGATIGANATIVCGCTIGKYALIGAGCVIREDVENYACISGNPAKKIGYVGEYGHRLIFDTNNIAIEKESNYKYRLTENGVVRI